MSQNLNDGWLSYIISDNHCRI